MKSLNANAKAGLFVIACVLAVALLSIFWTPYDPLHAIPNERLEGSSAQHWMGTDRYGRDVLSQIMVGSRISLLVGVVAVTVAAVIGVPLGIAAGMNRGVWDAVIMRLSDVLLAFPALLMAIVATAMFGSSTTTAMVAIGIASVPAFARVTRASTMRIMSQDFILAAKDAQRSTFSIAIRHVLPNILGVAIVQASIAFALAILAEAGLSFLGLGTPPPEPSWGRMLQSAQSSLSSAPWLAIWPGAAIALTVLGFNLFGDGLRDQVDPRHETSVRA
ncbi:ABC transporter permease [Corynebacterium pseudopelargi]|uniref:Glutathione transport system permease protein GsiD n=1 Tax=Corynebacterium pseudopelargi TaxID=2080757 RepID=A0A3G6IT33_9CORY|nr:ABC transporter permease [Corynebacterium pseudopelargi]AZA08773.1 Glutathione transport system permease protein GsiD [Corynebacterium pseudopelargi]